MKHLFAVMTALLLLISSTTLHAQQEKQYLTILNLNDTHSNLLPGAPRNSTAPYDGQIGGIARAATVIEQHRSAEERLIVLHGGDAFIGDAMYNLPALMQYTSPELTLLNMLQIDAMACGNHEFDFGPNLLWAILNDVNPSFPLVSANIKLQPPYTTMFAPYISDYTVIDRAPFKVGVIGLTIPSTNMMLTPGGGVWFHGMDESEIMDICTDLTEMIMTDLIPLQQCNVIVLLSHMGMELDRIIAKNVPGINLVVSAHDHEATYKPVKVKNAWTQEDVHLVSTAGFYRQIGEIRLQLHNGRIDLDNYDIVELNGSVQEDPMVKAIVEQTRDGIESMLGFGVFTQPVGFSTGFFTEEEVDLTKPGRHDTHVGNLVADAFQSIPGVQIGLEPGGSTAQPLYPGMVLAQDLYRMIGYGAYEQESGGPGSNPFGYAVVIIQMDGASLKLGLEATLAEIDVDDEMFLQTSSDFQYFYNPHAPVGQRVKAMLYQGSPIDPEETYVVATNYLVLKYLEMLGIPTGSITILDDGDPSGPRAVSEFELVMQYVVSVLNSQLVPGTLPGRVQALCSSVIPPPLVKQSDAKIQSNSPNPFTGETAVTFSLEQAAPVTLKVYDMVGREVATLHQGFAAKGTHTVRFTADRLPAGLYFCRLLTPNGLVQTLKIMKTR
ncbi:MAG: 5'-nucleotidase C-terminal domain-containing protein [Bacteroidetes bacterium]|nr:5'-nucleotidase C-terminal domain-containing protein [Bacteroidota bacterium]